MSEEKGSRHVKYIITVEEVLSVTSSEIERFCTHEEPTEIKSSSHYDASPAYKRDYDVRTVLKTREERKQLYRQETNGDESELDLVAVISAVNGQSVAP